MLDGEVVEQITLAKVLSGLRNKLSTLHLRVPCCGRVDGYLKTVSLSSVSRIFVGRVESEVMAGRLGAMDVL